MSCYIRVNHGEKTRYWICIHMPKIFIIKSGRGNIHDNYTRHFCKWLFFNYFLILYFLCHHQTSQLAVGLNLMR